MATRSRGSRGRPVFWAVVGCRVVGGLILLLGAAGLALAMSQGTPSVLGVLLTGTILMVGTCYLYLAQRLVRGRAWAGICGIVLACLTLLFVVAVIVIEAMLVAGFGNGDVTAGVAGTFAGEGVCAIALIWLIWQLWRAVRTIQRDAAESGHGFAVIPVAVVAIETEGPA